MQPRRGRAELEHRKVQLRRAVVDSVKIFQQKMLAIICPLAGNSCLNKYEYRSGGYCIPTHQGIPLLYTIEGINSNLKISC